MFRSYIRSFSMLKLSFILIKSGSPSVISIPDFTYNFDWNKVKILDREPSYNKRLTSEMIFIKRNKRMDLIYKATQNRYQKYTLPLHKRSPS